MKVDSGKKLTLFLSMAVVLLSVLVLPVSVADTLACSQPAKSPKDLGTLVIAGKPDNAPALQWGTEQGCFKKYGLTIKSVIVASSPVATAGMVSGSYDLIVSTPISLVQLMTNGDFKVKIVAPRFGYTAAQIARAKQDPLYPGELLMEVGLLVKKDSPIKSFKDLEKKKIGLATLQSASHAGVLLGIKAAHGNPSTAQVLVVPAAQSSAALQRGDVDAIAVSEPYASQAILDGARLLGYPGAYFYKPSPAIVYASSDATVNKKRAAMRAFQKATLEINRLLNMPQYDAGYRKIYADVTGVTLEAAKNANLPVLMERNVSLGELRYLPLELYALGFTRTKIDISSIVLL